MIRAGKCIADFQPLHHECAAVTTFECNGVSVQEPSKPCTRGPTQWREELKADYAGLTDGQRSSFTKLIDEYSDIFAHDSADLGRTDLAQHEIDTGSAEPVKQAARRLPPFKRDVVDRQLKELLEQGRIEPSNSPWSSPIDLAKKRDGTYRLCVDYRRVKALTVKDAQPLPRTDDILEALEGVTWFSCLDLASGYWQLPVRPEDRPKTAFMTHQGQFQWTCMPFGLTNGPASFMRMMNLALKGLTWTQCLVYLDDIVVWGNTFEDHLERFRTVFGRLRGANWSRRSARSCNERLIFWVMSCQLEASTPTPKRPG